MRKLISGIAAAGAVLLAGASPVAAQDRSGEDHPSVAMPLPRPGMGWTTYNYFVARHNQELLSTMAEAFVASGLRDAGYTILRIDGGWWGDDGNKRHYYWTEPGSYRGGWEYRPGDPHVDPRNYPQGLKGLSDALHSKGMKLGFYLSPALSMGQSENHPGNGSAIVPPPMVGKDLVERHARFVADGGVDHLFFDGYDWNLKQGLEPYVWMSAALRREAARVQRPIAFSINSGWKGRLPDRADEWRTSRDIDGKWDTLLECLSSVADPKPAGGGRWNNPDCLMVGFLPDEEARSQMSLWCVAGAPLYLASDFRVMNEWERYVLLNTEAIAVDQDPLGRCGRRVRADGRSQVWARELAGGGRAVVLLNLGEVPADLGVEWSEIGLRSGPARVRDLWEHRTLGVFQDRFFATGIPPRGARMLLLVPGEAGLPDPPRTWAPHPGPLSPVPPLSMKGWSWKTDLPGFDLGKATDGDPRTNTWSALRPGRSLEVTFPEPLRVDRLLIDFRGTGPHPWPYTVYAPRSSVEIQGAEGREPFRKITEATLGPSYLLAGWKAAPLTRLRISFTRCERTDASHDATWDVRDIYLFDGSASRER